MYYVIYKTTNIINGKYYIGKHQTTNLDDGYQGSGIILKRAIQKYGKENFVTEFLEIFDNERHMNLAEKVFVVPDSETNYNLCPGGKGGFGFINKHENIEVWNKQNGSKGGASFKERLLKDKNLQKKTRKNLSKNWTANNIGLQTSRQLFPNGVWFGRKHTEDTKQKMSLSNSDNHFGEKNSQFGSFWVTDGTTNKKIKNGEVIPDNFYKGRTLVNTTSPERMREIANLRWSKNKPSLASTG